jgi:3-hydroxyisobutyrate dehydrogenase
MRSLTASFSSSAADDSPVNVAFVGLGNMGMQMALNLAKSSDALPPLRLTVHDLQQSNIDSFFEHAKKMDVDSSSLSAAGDLASVGESNPDFIVSSLPTCEASETVVGEIVQSLPSTSSDETGCVFIDTSTISPNVSKTLQQLVTSVSPNHNYIDAPVSGGVKGASNATLTFMVGCSSSETFDTIQPLLQRMGKGIIPCGGPGSGSAVKLCNNLALAAQMIGICEAMNLGESLGVDPAVLAGAMNISTAKCWSSEVNNPHPIAAREIGSGASANGYEGGFGAALMLKDLNLATDVGEKEGLALPVAGLSRDLYRMADLHGCGKKDFGVMLEFLKGVK